MSKILWNSVVVNPVVLGVFLVGLAHGAIAAPTPKARAAETPDVLMAEIGTQTETADGVGNTGVLEQIQRYSDENGDGEDSIDQVTNASQFRDVQPSDWAYEALDRIVQKYGCLVGYPDRTYRGSRALSRYEFAAGLNACLRQIETLIANRPQSVSRSDFEAVQRLREEFRTELATIGSRIDNLESRTAFVEGHSFSTTTKLNGEAIFALAGVASGQNAFGEKIPKVTAFGDRVRLNFDTSFNGKDLLRVRLQALNLDAFSGSVTRVPEGDLRFAGGTFVTGNNNGVGIDALVYSFPAGKKTTFVVEGNAGQPDDYTNTVNPYIDNDGASGALSNFGTRNPIYNLLNGGGLGIRHQFSDNLELSLGYIATTPSISSPAPKNGLFNGPYGAIAQVTIKPSDKFTFGLTYVHSYNDDLTAGSRRANLRSYLASISAPVTPTTSSSAGSVQPADSLAGFGGIDLPVSQNAYGFEASFQLNPKFVINGWVGYTATRILSTAGGVIDRGDLSTLNYAVNFAFPDLGKKGNLGGIIFGMEPKVTRVSDSLKGTLGADRNTSLHVEGFYQYQFTDNIAVTPGIIWLTAPDFNNSNAGVVIGTIRTTFTF